MVITFDEARVISLIVSVVIPLLSALIYKAHWSLTVIGIITLALSFANGFFTQWADGGSTFNWEQALLLTVADFVLAVVAHKGVWKATPLEGTLIAIGSRTPPGTTTPPTAAKAA